ncbi:MAG TPA: hypothetical protein VHY35_00975 [Stellaceae bacterium]|nr:hypothetical protein [Stellaceae bacterium]
MKLFQIEEPDGSPVDPDAPGLAIGIDLSGTRADVAVSVGGNAVVLTDRDGFAVDLTIPAPTAPPAVWQELFEGARLRAERALAQPVTHAVIALAALPDAAMAALLMAASEAAGLELLQMIVCGQLAPGEEPVLAAAMLAEDMAPRSEGAAPQG